MQKGNIGVTTENIFPIIKKFLYSDHEIFLRELVSNAVDATQKLNTLASIGEFKGELGDLTIHVELGKDTITISDRGIGLTAEEIEKYHKENNQLWVLITYQRDSASSTPQVLLSNFLPVQHIPCTDPNTAFHLITKKLQCLHCSFSLTSTILLTLLLSLSFLRDPLSSSVLHVLLYPF